MTENSDIKVIEGIRKPFPFDLAINAAIITGFCMIIISVIFRKFPIVITPKMIVILELLSIISVLVISHLVGSIYRNPQVFPAGIGIGFILLGYYMLSS